MIYLDNNATTKTLPSVNEKVLDVLRSEWGNPSSLHQLGSNARSSLVAARKACSEFLGVDDDEIYFGSSGTEVNNLAIRSGLANNGRVLITSVVEHSSILQIADKLESEGREVIYLPVDSTGLVSLKSVEDIVSKAPSIISIQGANSETGVIQPISQLAELSKKYGAFFHSDFAQYLGRVPINLKELALDYVTFSGHKLHAPKGVGVLFAKRSTQLSSLLYGGTQEKGIFPGTENLAAIAGLGVALESRRINFNQLLERLSCNVIVFLEKLLSLSPDVELNTIRDLCVPNTLNLYFPGVQALALVSNLSEIGVACSHTSACVSARPEPSYVLTAMGLSEERASESLRVSFSILNTMEEAEEAAEIFSGCYEKLRKTLLELYGT